MNQFKNHYIKEAQMRIGTKIAQKSKIQNCANNVITLCKKGRFIIINYRNYLT